MNNVYLSGIIKNIEPSHCINGIQYNKANIIIPRAKGKEDIIVLKYKEFTNKNNYKDGDTICLLGNVRTYSIHQPDGTDKISVYVFTYFDKPEETLEDNTNKCEISGRICKISNIRYTKDNNRNIHFILANNIENGNGRRYSSYIPCIAWGKIADSLSKFSVNTQLELFGELHSNNCKKKI